MEIIEFQQKLMQICKIAENNNKEITREQVCDFFSNSDLDAEQFAKIFQYLKLKGISIEGMISEGAVKETEDSVEEDEAVPLTAEEKQYLKEYLQDIIEDSTEEATEELAQKVKSGDEDALRILTNRYMIVAANMAVELNCEEIYIADLIQEANLSFLMALNEDAERKDDAWFKGRILAGIKNIIEEQTQQKFEDDYLVSKVQNLETAVKGLTDDEEDSKFSIEELSVFLDMDVEEIRDVLRLTGDDK